MTPLRLAAEDVGDEKGRSALAEFELEELGPNDRERFVEAYAILDAEFGARGELERREVIETWLFGGGPSLRKTYFLLVACDRNGAIAAVRDCHVRVHEPSQTIVAYLAHVLVLPAHRRGGLGSIMRAAPLALARRIAHERGGEPNVLLAAEMEPVDPEEIATRIRLVAYARAGFSAVDPEYLPYCQPDFRDLATLGEEAKPLPLVAVVRWLHHEGATRLPAPLARAYVEVLYDVFATHCREQDLALPRMRALRPLEGRADVPLVKLPTSIDDLAPFSPLLRERVLSLHRV